MKVQIRILVFLDQRLKYERQNFQIKFPPTQCFQKRIFSCAGANIPINVQNGVKNIALEAIITKVQLNFFPVLEIKLRNPGMYSITCCNHVLSTYKNIIQFAGVVEKSQLQIFYSIKQVMPRQWYVLL